MTKGFLIVDQQMNTLILPMDDPDLVEFLRYKPEFPRNIDRVHTHKTLKELDADVRAYLKGTYTEEER